MLVIRLRFFGALGIACCPAISLFTQSLSAQSPFTRLGQYSQSRQLPNYGVFSGKLLANVRVGSSGAVVVSDGTASSTKLSGFGSRASAGFKVVGDRLVLFEHALRDKKFTVVDSALRIERSGTLAGALVIGPVVDDAIYITATPNGSRTLLYRYLPADGSYRYLFHRTPRGGGGWTESVGRVPGVGAFVLVMNETVNFQRRRFLYLSDGTNAGTGPINEITASNGARLAVPVQNGLYYVAGDRTIKFTQGTTVRTFAQLPSSIGYVTDFALGERIWFAAFRSSSRPQRELYVLEGAGPRLVSGGLSGPTNVSNLTVVGDKLYFSASVRSGATGSDLWVSDGTEAGTHPVDNRAQAQRDARNPRVMASRERRGFALVRDKLLFFTGTTSANSALYAYRPPHAYAVRVAQGCGSTTSIPELGATTPKLGSTMELTSTGLETGAFAVAVLGAPSHQGIRLDGACVLRVDPRAPLLIADAWSPSNPRITRIVVPNDLRLDGVALHAQLLQLGRKGRRRTATSNAVYLRLGR